MLALYPTEAPSHKADIKELEAALATFLPNWDQNRVYPSDVRKLFQWFNLLIKAGAFEVAATEENAAPKEAKAPKMEAVKKKATTAAPAAKAAKPAAPKKPTAVKTGSSRGK
jgi:uncharacterized membrane protein